MVLTLTRDELTAKFLQGVWQRYNFEYDYATDVAEIGDLTKVDVILIELASAPAWYAKALRQGGFRGSIVLFGWTVAWHYTEVREITSPPWGCAFATTDELCQILKGLNPLSLRKPVSSTSP